MTIRIKFVCEGDYQKAESIEDWLDDRLDSTWDGANFQIEGDDRIYQAVQVIEDTWFEVEI